MNLKNTSVVIIGGSQGIGRSLAEVFLTKGANVLIVSRTESALKRTSEEIGAKYFVADVRDEQQIRNAADYAVEQFGNIDIWVNSAGQFKKFPKEDLIDVKRSHEMFDVNFFGAVYGSRTALAHMQENGGIIINILSSAALDASRAVGAKLYAASKWALRGWIDAFRGENTDKPVQILSVYPGGTKTHLHDEALPADFENFMEPQYVVDKIIHNLEQAQPELDLIIKRPNL